MAKRALYQATERTTGVATDIMHIGNSNKDYKIKFDNLCQNINTYIQDSYYLTLPVQDISAANKQTDMTIYEPGGASAKLSGWRVTPRWSGGDGTYQQTFDTAFTIGGAPAADFVCGGSGHATFQLDLDNSDWIVVDDKRELVYTCYTNPGATTANTPILMATKVRDNYNIYASGEYTIPKTSIYQISCQLVPDATATFALYKGTTLLRNGSVTGVADMASTFCEYLVKGEKISIRCTAYVGSYPANRFVSIVEVRP